MRSLRAVNTVEKALKAGTPTIGKLSKNLGELQIENYIKFWLVDLNEDLNLKRPLQASNIDQIAFYVVCEYRNLTIADINLIFTNAKLGKYGEFYDSLTMPKVLKWFNDYAEDRVCEAEKLSYQKHVQQKTYLSNVPRGSESNRIDKFRSVGVKYQEHLRMEETKVRMAEAKERLNAESTKQASCS
jgi:hypothetical protein